LPSVDAKVIENFCREIEQGRDRQILTNEKQRMSPIYPLIVFSGLTHYKKTVDQIKRIRQRRASKRSEFEKDFSDHFEKRFLSASKP
jgi:hypothetical protein